MNKFKREDFSHIDDTTLDLVALGCGGLYWTGTEVIMCVSNNLRQPLPCGCASSNHYVVKRNGKNILEEITKEEYRLKEIKEVVRIKLSEESYAKTLKISIS